MATLGVHVPLGAGENETRRLMQSVQALEVDVAAVHDVESAGFRNHLIEDVDVVELAIADKDETGDITAQIEKRVHLYRGLGGSKRCPREQRERQKDRSRIQSIPRVGQIDAKRFVDIHLVGDGNQALREVRIDPPVARRVRIGQSVARYLTADRNVSMRLGHLVS